MRAGRRVTVIGAGVAGLVAAVELERSGYQVTVLEALPKILPGCDSDVADVVLRSFKKRGITVRTGVAVTGHTPAADGRSTTVGRERGWLELVRRDGHLTRRRWLEHHRHRRRGHLNDLNAERRVHLLGRQREQPASGARPPQVNHGDDIAGRDPAERARRAAHPHIHR